MMNLSVYAIPVYYFLTIAPHSYAVNVITSANNGRFENSNPRSSNSQAAIEKSVPAAAYARYERAQAAHFNGMENMTVFASAVVLGNLAQLPAGTLNGGAGAYLLFRVAYTLAYINITSHRASFVRTGIWATSTLLLLFQMVLAGNVLARKGAS